MILGMIKLLLLSRSRYESLRRGGALDKGGAYCVYWFQSRVLHRGGKKLSTGS